MGCTSSTESSAAVKAIEKPEAKTLPSSRTPSNLESRRETKIEDDDEPKPETVSTPSTLLDLGQFRVRYAFWSRRGRDPDDASKPNQDSYSIHHPFGDDKMDTFWGVYDGHGRDGEGCSGFVQERLPDLVSKKIQQHGGFFLTTDQVHSSLHEAHTQCNEELRAAQHINDSYSGTTSITMYLQGAYSRMTISNVGDSRAILGTKLTQPAAGAAAASSNDGLRAVPLSKDQTPYRIDEARRCTQSGARILSFGEIGAVGHEDEDDGSAVEDPPRIWAQNGRYPGTAFTRSLGDAVAEKLGVFAEPEMLTLKLSTNEKVIVLASDGIFDVMSNQEVIDMCFQYYDKQDPAQACSAVIEHSHKEWLKAEDCEQGDAAASYDDMTIACIFVCHDEVKDEHEGNSTASAADVSTTVSATSSTDDPTSKSSQPHTHRRRVRQKTLRHLEEEM